MNIEIVKISGVDVEVVRKKIKNLHIGCYPPLGRVRVAAPENVSGDAIRTAVLTRMPWIRRKQAQFLGQLRQPVRQYVSGETHFFFGRPLRLEVLEWDKRVHRIAQVGSDRLTFQIPRCTTLEQKDRWMASWMKLQLRELATPRVANWATRIDVEPQWWGIRSMKTKWGSCNAAKGIVWLNSSLAKKPIGMIDYVILHELAHLVSPRHDQKFTAVLDREMPRWRTIRQELNALPLDAWRN